MIKVICLLFLFCSSIKNENIRQIQEVQTIRITSYEMETCELNDDKAVTIKLSQEINEDEEIIQAILTSSVVNELNSTSCNLEDDNLSIICEFNFIKKGVYYLKSLTSKSYKYILNTTLDTQIRYGLEGCDPNSIDAIKVINKQSFFVVKATCLPELYAQKEGSSIYYKISCSSDAHEFKCKFPSNLEINEERVSLNIFYRKQCGSLESKFQINLFDCYLSGQKYINFNDASDTKYYYTLTTTEKLSNDKNIELISDSEENPESILLFDICTEVQSVIPYKYNCTISKDMLYKGTYEFSDNYDNIIEQVIVVYEPETVEFKETPIGIDSKTPNNETKVVSLYFKTDVNIEDSPENSVRGITFKSNSQKISVEEPCVVKEDNKTIVECKLIVEEDCLLSFYYKNKTEQYVLINEKPIEIGTGIPSSYNSSSFMNNNIYFFLLMVILFL